MCWRYRITFVCGCRTWSRAHKKCDVANDGKKCNEKKIFKHLYSPLGLECEYHGYSRSVRNTSSLQLRQDEPQDGEQVQQVEGGCRTNGCCLPKGHPLPHRTRNRCWMEGCLLSGGHPGEHKVISFTLSTEAAEIFEEHLKELSARLQKLNRTVLIDMGKQTSVLDTSQSAVQHNNSASLFDDVKQNADDADVHPLFGRIKRIRLFRLFPRAPGGKICGEFQFAELYNSQAYTALSYTWGDESNQQWIMVSGSKFPVRKNLWDFLQQQSARITEPKFFWIDAICINQDDVFERNHQVALMKDIYRLAAEVYIWLGKGADNSDLAMTWLAKKATRKLRPRGPSGYSNIWSMEEGKALVRLCERPYWRRMWIIQEVLHANNITLLCGSKSVKWAAVESLYLTLKTLEDESWWAHHEYVIGVLQSPAAIMVWQRAHWRHPGTLSPHLQTLIEIFHDWQCKDIRDKVFALTGMARKSTSIVPDYSMTPRDVYFAVCEKHPDAGWKFENLLSQVLGLSGRDIKLRGQTL
ncbi:HET-domain-containing protein [Aaosphaeria arxii CBS 175.79]|uniref:HET-domain-containing protein n=1 Tax=Aaosphaeria arxii CBS 175.79 TaxID=1450172 RepID=A0A6A5Y578_9PLEO|nr:HET-domain-containing protein [Aaosphaeria arxii CBS 175.79]KAF2020197.1 HET-domain-containing protein [Aaosphaeria arxii CBS 175.79]